MFIMLCLCCEKLRPVDFIIKLNVWLVLVTQHAGLEQLSYWYRLDSAKDEILMSSVQLTLRIMVRMF